MLVELAVCHSRYVGVLVMWFFLIWPLNKRTELIKEEVVLVKRLAHVTSIVSHRSRPRSVLLVAEKHWHVPWDSNLLTEHKPPICKVLHLACAPVAIRGVVKSLTKTLPFFVLLLSFSMTYFSLSQCFLTQDSWMPLHPVLFCEPWPCIACRCPLLMITSHFHLCLGLLLPSGVWLLRSLFGNPACFASSFYFRQASFTVSLVCCLWEGRRRTWVKGWEIAVGNRSLGVVSAVALSWMDSSFPRSPSDCMEKGSVKPY